MTAPKPLSNPCKKCGGPAWTTATRPDTPTPGMTFRYKECRNAKCGHKWNTIEMTEISGMAALFNPDESKRHRDEAVEIATVAVAAEMRGLLVKVLEDFDRRFKPAAAPANGVRYALPNGSSRGAAAPAAKTAKRPAVRPGERERPRRSGGEPRGKGKGKITRRNPEGIPYNTRAYIDSKAELLPVAFRKDADEIRSAYEALPKGENGARQVPDSFKELVRTFWEMVREAGVPKIVAAGAIGVNTSNLHRWVA